MLRDVRMLADLDEARLTGTAGAGRYEAAFRVYGIDVLALDQPKAAARIRTSAIREALLAGLDAWMEIKGDGLAAESQRLADAQRADLRRLADAADDNAWRRAFREAALAADNDRLKALAGQPEALAQPPAVLDRLGSVLMARNLRGEAVAVWRQAQQRHPADFWINYNLGNALHSPPGEPSGKDFVLSNTEALSYCRAAVAIRPSSAEALWLLGAVLVVTGDLDAALVAYQQAVALAPDSLDADLANNEVMLGDALRRRGRRDEAVACYKNSIELYPLLPQADRPYRKLLEVLKEQGKLDEVVAFDKKLIESVAFDKKLIQLNAAYQRGWPHGKLLEVLKEQGKLDEVVAFDKKLIELDPTNYMRRHLLGETLKEQGKLDEAIAEYQEAIRVQPDNLLAHVDLGAALAEQGRYQDAEAAYREAIRLQPQYTPHAHIELGNVLYAQGRKEEAETEYRTAVEQVPKDAEIHCNLGRALLDQGRHKEAEAEYREAIRLKPEYALAHNDLGVALFKQGRYKEAEAEYREAIRLKADDPVLRLNLGDTLSNQGQHEKAAAAFSEAIRLQPENGWCWVQRGWAYADLGQWEKASADFAKATECKQPSADAWYSQAMLCLRDGNLDGYRKICADMLQRFGKGDDPDAGSGAAWTCADPDFRGRAGAVGLPVGKGAGQRAEGPLERQPARGGAVSRRPLRGGGQAADRGDRVECRPLPIEHALHLVLPGPGPPSPRPCRRAHCWLDKAIQGTEEALKLAAAAPGKSAEPTGVIPPNWNRKLTLQLLHREAEELIQGAATKPGK